MLSNKCNYCSKTFSNRKNVNRHALGCLKNPGRKSSLKCDICEKVFFRSDSFKQHKPRCSNLVKRYKNCLYENCTAKFYTKNNHIEHLRICHEASIEDPKELHFPTVEAFKAWKEEEEESTYSYYSKSNGQKGKIEYYCCQHDGSDKPHCKKEESAKQPSRKHLKGRIKTGKTCLANIKVVVREDGSVFVKYQPVHCHPLKVEDFQHHPLSTSTKTFINQQLAMGLSPKKIAKKLKEDSAADEVFSVGRNSFVSAHRIHAIAKRRRMKMRNHEDDAISVSMLVQRLLKDENDSVVIYKPINHDKQLGPERINQLKDFKEIFMLGIQTREQREMMKVGAQKILSVDIMHDTNVYGYQLLNLVVPDKYHRGYQVGHFIASRMDSETVSCFFEAITKKCPGLFINCIITDGDLSIAESISDVFGRELPLILCMWRLHRTFKKKLCKLAPKKFVNEMYEALCAMMDCSSEVEFQTLSVEFQQKYVKAAPNFIEYFATYFETASKWARCYRMFPHGEMDTILLNEPNRNRLQTMKHASDKRLDDLVNILLEIEEDNCTSYQTEEILGVPFGLCQTTDRRHKKGLEISDKDVRNVYNGHWDVTSQSDKATKYQVVRCCENCPNDRCLYTCTEASCYKLCAHLYLCTCLDRSPLCKHIHKVHTVITLAETVDMGTAENFNVEDISDTPENDIRRMDNDVGCMDTAVKLASIKNNWLELTELLEKESVQNTLLDHIDVTISDLLQACRTVNSSESDVNVDGFEKQNEGFSSAANKEIIKTSSVNLKHCTTEEKEEENVLHNGTSEGSPVYEYVYI